ncbi:hypothetical protein D3C87_1543230 [compost metagenome]
MLAVFKRVHRVLEMRIVGRAYKNQVDFLVAEQFFHGPRIADRRVKLLRLVFGPFDHCFDLEIRVSTQERRVKIPPRQTETD